ncbi:hypothetical protein M2G67_22025, partial [Vibrio vulnificus]|nr:hypothetical protein [Vibrio vulnificus]
WLCRWLNPDPAGTVDGLNLFRMVRNNPIILLDSDGLSPGTISDLPRTDPMFGIIEKHLLSSAESKPVTAPKKEPTRMGYARDILNSPDSTKQQKERARLRLREGEPGGAPLVKSGRITITKIEEISNPELDERYDNYKREINIPPNAKTLGKTTPTTTHLTNGLDENIGEVFLIHGASNDLIAKIAENGFRPDLSRNKGTEQNPRYGALGQGTYFSDSIGKTMTYTQDPALADYDRDSSSEFQLILAKVILGVPKVRHPFAQLGGSLRKDDVGTLKEGRHSVYSRGVSAVGLNPFKAASGTNEFLVKNAAAMNPKYIIHWKHNN